MKYIIYIFEINCKKILKNIILEEYLKTITTYLLKLIYFTYTMSFIMYILF